MSAAPPPTLSSPPGAPPWRLEYKYALTPSGADAVRAALRAYVRSDFYSRRAGGAYFVRSLYFDTDDYRSYCEKMAGERARIKMRLRTYAPERAGVEFVSVELKARDGWLVRKFAGRVDLDAADRFASSRIWPAAPDRSSETKDVLNEFMRLAHLADRRPRVLVDYRREALEPLDGSDLRITFDFDLRFQAAAELYPPRGPVREPVERLVVLEIKTQTTPPAWLQRIVRRHELKSVPNSKFALGIERTQEALAFVHQDLPF